MPGRGVYWKVDGSNKTGVAFEQLDSALQGQVSGGGSGGHVIQDEGTGLPQEPILNFVGAGVTVTDGTGKTIVTIPGGGGAGLEILDTALLQEEFYWRELQGGGVEKLFETTLTVAVNTITAAVTPVDFADYSEFWLIVNGKHLTEGSIDCFVEMNAITSLDYNLHGSFNSVANGNVAYSAVGTTAWGINPNGVNLASNTSWYFKLKLSGGVVDATGQTRKGTLEGAMQLNSADAKIIANAYLDLANDITTQLSQFRVFTNGSVFQIGTKVAVYGVSPIKGAFHQKYNVRGFLRHPGEDNEFLGVIKLETPGTNGAGFVSNPGVPASIDTGTGDNSGFRVSTITRRNITMKQVLTVIDTVGAMSIAGMLDTAPTNHETETSFLAGQDNGFGFIFSAAFSFWRIWTKQSGALTIQTTTVAPTNGIDVRQTLEAKIILGEESSVTIEYRIDGVLVGTLTTNDPQSNGLFMYSGVFGTGVLTTTKELDVDTWEVQVDRVLTAPPPP